MVDIIVSGHLCLDMLPDMRHVAATEITEPGRLVTVGPMTFSTGGVVSNTGLALWRLGVDVAMQATVGADMIGRMILDILRGYVGERLDLISLREGVSSSYSVVLSPGLADRVFLHCTGNNAVFSAADVPLASVRGAKLFHLGYPPLLPKLVESDGAELARVFQTARRAGAITSLDDTLPDPDSEMGAVDWRAVHHTALKHVDMFVPSLDEALFMFRRADFDRWRGRAAASVSYSYLDGLADELLAEGPAIVGFKLGEYGVFLKTAGEDRFDRLRPGGLAFAGWSGRTVYHPAFQVNVAGTTGAGDAAYAGLLAAAMRGLSIDEAARWSCAVGACCCEGPDAVSGVRTWDDTAARLAAGWPFRPERLTGLPE